jgi:phosphoribosylformimino-5-aminoimidazole carboxamide ribotide isomerase
MTAPCPQGKRLGDRRAADFNSEMRIIPVLDLTAGVVVRAAGGRRREYRPVVSPLTTSSRPLDVADAFRAHFGLTELYVADLDAIGGAPPALDLYAALRAAGFRLWVDAGVLAADRALALAEAGIERVVVGLETAAGPDVLADACREYGDRVVFSLDLKGGMPLGDAAAWGGEDARAVAEKAVAAGARRLLVLDLARVGGGGGTHTEGLCARLAAAHPGVEVSAGGGVRDVEDLRRLKACGVRAALVASALHDGGLRKEDLEELGKP